MKFGNEEKKREWRPSVGACAGSGDPRNRLSLPLSVFDGLRHGIPNAKLRPLRTTAPPFSMLAGTLALPTPLCEGFPAPHIPQPKVSIEIAGW